MPAATANTGHSSHSVTAYAKALLASVKAALIKSLTYRRRMDELQSLDERELHDIGIGRSDFESIARGTYGR